MARCVDVGYEEVSLLEVLVRTSRREVWWIMMCALGSVE